MPSPGLGSGKSVIPCSRSSSGDVSTSDWSWLVAWVLAFIANRAGHPE
jgi:hypothetical protein